MASNTPPISPEGQPPATTKTVPGSPGPGRRPWLEPAVVVAVVGVAVTLFGLLLSIVFGIYSMNSHIDALGSELKADIRDLNACVDALGASVNTRMDTLGSELKADIRDLNVRVDALGSDFNARMDALGANFNIRIEQVYQLLLPEER